MPQRRSYPLIVLSPDDTPFVHVTMSVEESQKAVKKMFLPYAGKCKSEVMQDVGIMHWRETSDKQYDKNTTACALAQRDDIRGQAVIVGIPKTKDKPSSLSADFQTRVINTFNSFHGLPLIAAQSGRSTGAKRPPPPKSALKFYMIAEEKRYMARKEDCDAEVVEKAYNELEDKTEWIEKAEADQKRYDAALAEYNSKHADDLEKPVGARNAFLYFSTANLHIPHKDRGEAWKACSDQEKYRAEARQDKIRYEKQLQVYNAKVAECQKFLNQKKKRQEIDVVGSDEPAPKKLKSILKKEPEPEPEDSSSDSSGSDEE